MMNNKKIDYRIKEVLINENQLKDGIQRAADWINHTYANDSILIITILKGSIPFVGALLPLITVDVEIDFICMSSFKGSTKALCSPELISSFTSNITNKNIVLVEDIVDSGNTISKVMELIKQNECKSCKLLTLLDKPEGRKVELIPDFKCFNIRNEFVVGFGLDYKELLRNLPYIGILKEEVYKNKD